MQNEDMKDIEMYKSGDNSAFNRIYNRHRKKIYYYLLKACKSPELAEDLLQETFIMAFKKIDQYEGKSKYYSYLVTIALNRFRNYLRCKKNNKSLHTTRKDNIYKSCTQEYNMLKDEIKTEINKIVKTLPKKQKKVIYENYWNEKSFVKIAQEQDLNYNTVKANYRHGLNNLKSNFSNNKYLNSLNNTSFCVETNVFYDQSKDKKWME